ncbi:hypothetical protein LINPERPRIM_LOCUS24671 [Linum perenne]
MAKLQFGHPNSIGDNSVSPTFPLLFWSLKFFLVTDLAQLTLQLTQNGPGSYESLISVRLKSRNRSSGHPTRYL